MSDFNTLLAVRDLMAKNIVTESSGATIQQVAAVMADKQISSVILTSDSGKIAGIITETDIVRQVVAKGQNSAEIQAEAVMSGEVHKIDGGASIFDARGKMSELGVKHMIVVEGDKPVGIISATALLGS